MKLKLIILLLSLAGVAVAQSPDSSRTKGSLALGEGLQFSINQGAYQFKITGLVQPNYAYLKTDKKPGASRLNSKRTYLTFSGKAIKERVSFLVTTDFSAPIPLLDAYIAYHLSNRFTASVGQRRNFTNTRELTFEEYNLQFTNRGNSTTLFNNSGREFGLFLEGKIGTKSVLVPQASITSGDGANSFGINSTDYDYGGFKYGGRLDWYVFGMFKQGNQGFAADLGREKSLKMVIGGAGSINQGASNDKGEGHGQFLFYNKDKDIQLPEQRKIHADILVKYRGFSLLGEYVNVTAAGLNGLYQDTSATAAAKLKPTQIAQFMTLGNAWNVQAGYVTKSGYGISGRYENIDAEFGTETGSKIADAEVFTVGLVKYINGNNLKIQTDYTQVRYPTGLKTHTAELLVQIIF
jgi:hypothetical protein